MPPEEITKEEMVKRQFCWMLPGGRGIGRKEYYMDKNSFLELLLNEPIIAAVKDDEDLAVALESDVNVIFLLYGDICSIKEIVSRICAKGKHAFVHVDFVEGLSAREISVDFIAKNTRVDGIISTKTPITRRARELGLVSIRRFFILDSMSLQNVEKQFYEDSCDMVEILPGMMPKIIRRMCDITHKPMIAAGLISDKEDVIAALGAGAVAISSSTTHVWQM